MRPTNGTTHESQFGGAIMNEAGRRTISQTDLPEAGAADLLYAEWNTYRREAARLLAEGGEGKFVLIKGDQVVSLHDTWDIARQAGLRLYLLEPFLVHEIRSEEPILRLRGYSLPCPG
jgi:hypothetical protein